jgi:hypothetical protein
MRHAQAGTIRRLARGLYDHPTHHPRFGILTPSSDGIAKALTMRDAIRIQPAGAYAANVLGLSEQVPSKIVFLTDGATRHVKLGRREIILQHTTPRYMATAGRKSGTMIQALRYLGRKQVDSKALAILRRQITAADRPQLLRDLRHAPAWIAEILRQLAQTPA